MGVLDDIFRASVASVSKNVKNATKKSKKKKKKTAKKATQTKSTTQNSDKERGGRDASSSNVAKVWERFGREPEKDDIRGSMRPVDEDKRRVDSVALRGNTGRTREELERIDTQRELERNPIEDRGPARLPDPRRVNTNVKSLTYMPEARYASGGSGRTKEELDRRDSMNELARMTPEEWLDIQMDAAEIRNKYKGVGPLAVADPAIDKEFNFTNDSTRSEMARNANAIIANWQHIPEDQQVQYATYLLQAYGVNDETRDIVMGTFRSASAKDKLDMLEEAVYILGNNNSYVREMGRIVNADPMLPQGMQEKYYDDTHETITIRDEDGTYRDVEVRDNSHQQEMIDRSLQRMWVNEYRTNQEQQHLIDQYIDSGHYSRSDALKAQMASGVQSWLWDMYDAGAFWVTGHLRNGQEGIEFTKPGDNLKTLRDEGIGAFLVGTVSNRLRDIYNFIGIPAALFSKAVLSPEDVDFIERRLFSVGGKWRDEIARQDMIYQSSDLDPASKFMTEAIRGTVEMVPGIVASVVATPAAGLAVFGAKAGGASARDAYEQGATLDEAVQYGLTVGTAEVVTEKLFMGFGFMGKGILAPALRKVIPEERILTGTTRRILEESGFMNSTSFRVLRGVAASGGEATEEMIMEIVSPYIERTTYNPEAMDATFKEVLYAGGLGAAIGGILGIPVMISNVSNEANRKKEFDELIDDFRKQKYAEIDEAVATGEMTPEQASMMKAEAEDILEGKGSLNVSSAVPEEKVAGEALDTVYDTYEEAKKAMMQEARTKKDGEKITANYIDNGVVKTFSTTAKGGTLGLGRSTEAGKEYQRIAQAKNVTERSGYQLNVKEEIIKEVASLSKAIGREVEFYRNDDASDHGYMDKKTGKIYINAGSSQSAARSVIAHELTHQMESTAGWNKLVELMKKHYGSSYESRRQERIDAYEAFGKPLKVDETRKTYDEADQELVAMFVEEKLLTDADTIREVVNTDKTLAQKIIAWINKVIQKLAGSKEQKMLVEARDLWNQALQEEKSGNKKAPKEGAGERHSFGGVNARTADLKALENAKDMLAKNHSAVDIFRETGWFVGADGKWRFEIDDSNMSYHKDGKKGNPDQERQKELYAKMFDGSITQEEMQELSLLEKNGVKKQHQLEDYIDHQELFEAYPELRTVELQFRADMESNEKGSYSPDKNIITISSKLKNAPEETLVHEIQHAIQKIENFSGGSSAFGWAVKDADGNITKRFADEYAELRKGLSKEDSNRYARYEDLSFAMDQMLYSPDAMDEARYERYEKESDDLYSELYHKPWFLRLNDLKRLMENDGYRYRYLYTNSAGEIEARDAASRRKMTADERRNRMPDTGDENTVFPEEDIRWSVGSSDKISELENRISELQEKDSEMNRRLDKYRNAPEHQEMMNAIGVLKDDDLDKAVNEYKEWYSSSGYEALHNEEQAVYEELRELRIELENAKKEKAKNDKENYRALFNEEFNKKYATKAARHFGTTGRFDYAGYLTVNGSLLDFSDGQRYRVRDHREISEVLDFLPEDHGYSDALIEFMNMGNIRMQTYGIDISVAPNAKQKTVLRKFFDSLFGEVTVDFSRENGDSAGSVDYPEGTRSERIIRDIDNYFKTGVVPEISETQRYRYSIASKDAEYVEAVESGDMGTAQRLVREAANIAGFTSPKLHHGTKAFGFTQLRTKDLDIFEWSPFFATPDPNLAETYSGETERRQLRGGYPKATQDQIDDYLAEYYGVLKKRIRAIDKHLSKPALPRANDAKRRSLMKDARNELANMVEAQDAKTLSEAYNRYIDAVDALEKTAMLPAEEALFGFDEVHKARWEIGRIIGAENVFVTSEGKLVIDENREEIESDTAGIYSFYANLDGMLDIDGEGKNWNHIDGSKIGKDGDVKTRDVALYAKENGYTGVIIRNIYDSGGQTDYYEPGDIYIFFDPAAQVKSADTVTYDDNNEVIPLSERFNEENNDIRWSVGSSNKLMRDVINDQNRKMREVFYRRNKDDREALWAMIEDEEAYIARTGGYRHKMVQDIIDFAYETGYRKGDDGKDVVNSWGRESIYIPEKYRGEMETLGGLAEVNREMFGSGISFTYKKKGGGLDDAYRVLREENEGMMPDTMDPSEQVQTIIDLFGTGRNMKRLKELDDEAWEEFGQEDRPFYMDIEQAVYSAVEELSAIARVNMVDAARELDQKTIAAQEKALKKAENQKDFTKQEKADLREKLKENKKKYNAELERRRKEADAEWKASQKSLAKIAKEYEKGNAEKARELVEEEQKRIDSMYRKTDKELRKEKADAIVKEYFKQRKPADPNSTESTWLKSKSVKNIVDQFRRETITQLVYAGRLTVTNDNVIIDENQQEVAVRKDNMWDFSEVKNTYTPYFGITLLAKQEGIDVDQFFTMFAKIRDMQTRPKEDFKERSRKEEVVSYINSLNLTKKQKEFLYYDAARYAKSTMPTFLDGGSVVEEKGNIRGRMMEALDNISFDMFKGHLKEDSRWAKEDSAQIRQKDINDFVEMMFGAEDSVEKDAFLDIFTRMIVDYSEQMEEVRLVQTSNLLINKPKQSDPLKMRVVRAYREAKQNFLCEGEAYERMAEKMKNPLIRARYYQAKSAVATANEMINGKHQRNLAGDLMGKSLYRIFEPIFKADTKAKNSNGIELLTELVNNRHDIYRQKNGKGYTGNTIEECETIVENISTAHPEILKVADELVEYGRNLLRMCVECGRLSQEDFDYFVAKYPYYVPAYRVEENEVMDRSGKVRRDTAVIKTARFGNRDVLPLWDQMVRRTNEMVKACKKNQLAYELVKTTRYKGHEDFVSSVTKTIDQGNTENTMADLGQIEDIGKARRTQEDDTFIPWYCNGEKFDVDIADASLLYGWDRINYRMDEKQYHRVLRKMNSFRRAVLTQYNPTFWLTNHIRDISDLFLYNQHAHMLPGYMIEAYAEMFGGKLAGTKTFQKAYKKATGKEYVYNEEKRADALERYLSKGASQASIFEYDNTNAGRKTTKGKVQSAMKKPLEAFDAWNFMFEQIPRLAVFNETIDRLTEERDKGKNEYTDEEIESIAAYQAADATLNFGRSGTVVKNLNTYGCTFLNAGVQGMDRARRMFTQIKDGDKKTVMLNLCGLVFKIFAMGYSVHIILDWIYGGDDEYANAIREFLYGDDEEEVMQEWKEMSDYNKMNYLVININGVWFRIPQGRLSAFLYSFGYNGEKVFDGEMDALDLVEAQWDMAKETVLFGNPLTNNILGPVIEAWRNKDNWGNDIVSEYEDMGEGFHYLEYDDETSMAARKAAEFGHWLTADLFGVEGSRILDFSPKKLDHVMKQYFGSYANLLMPFLDGGTGLKDKVTEGLAETLFKKFYINPVESNRLAGDYYDLKEEFENTAKAHDNDSPYAVAVKVFDDYNELLKPLREQITAISDDPNLTAAEKAEQILALREEMNQIYRDAVADARDALGYAHANYYGKDGNSDLYVDWQRLTKGSDWVVSTMSDTAQAQFAEVSKTGVDAENFVSTYDFVKNATADKDENGKSINGSKKEKIVNYINSLDLTAEQKMSLYTNVAGYKVSGRSPAPDFVNGALVQPSTTNMASPLSGGGELTSGYGWRNCPFHGREFHAAVDISAESGTDVGAVISGTVTMATVHGGYGNSIEITSTDENGNTVVTKYNHLLNMGVEVGDVINQGTKIGEVGSTGDSTGPHLDFRLKINNDWVDPTQYIDLEASGIVNATGYTQKEGSGGTASGGGSSGGSSSGGSSRSGSTASVGSRTSQVASNRRSSGLTLPSVGGSGGNGGGSRASTPVAGMSTSAPTFGARGLYLPKASDYTPNRRSISSSVATTQRTGRTGGSFWDDNILS